MGIKHKTPKVSGEKGFATEWNDEHKIDSDVDFAGHSGVNLGEPISPTDIATKNYVDVQGVVGEGIKRKIYENYTQIFSSAGTSEATFTIPTSGLIIGFLLKADLREDSGYNNRGAAISLGATGTNLGTKYLTGYHTGLILRYSENYLHSFMWGDIVPGGTFNVTEGTLLYESLGYTTKQVNGFALLDMIDNTTTFTIKVYGSANGNGWMKNIRCEILYF